MLGLRPQVPPKARLHIQKRIKNFPHCLSRCSLQLSFLSKSTPRYFPSLVKCSSVPNSTGPFSSSILYFLVKISISILFGLTDSPVPRHHCSTTLWEKGCQADRTEVLGLGVAHPPRLGNKGHPGDSPHHRRVTQSDTCSVNFNQRRENALQPLPKGFWEHPVRPCCFMWVKWVDSPSYPISPHYLGCQPPVQRPRMTRRCFRVPLLVMLYPPKSWEVCLHQMIEALPLRGGVLSRRQLDDIQLSPWVTCEDLVEFACRRRRRDAGAEDLLTLPLPGDDRLLVLPLSPPVEVPVYKRLGTIGPIVALPCPGTQPL